MAVIAGTCLGSAPRRSPETEAQAGGPEGGKGAEASTTEAAVTKGSEEHPTAQTVHQSAPKAYSLPKAPQPSRKTRATPPNLQTQAQPPRHPPAPQLFPRPSLGAKPTPRSKATSPDARSKATSPHARSEATSPAAPPTSETKAGRISSETEVQQGGSRGAYSCTPVREHARRRWAEGIGRKPPSLTPLGRRIGRKPPSLQAAAQRAYIADQPIPRNTRKRPMTAKSNLRSARRLTTSPQPIANVWSPFAKWYDTPSVPST